MWPWTGRLSLGSRGERIAARFLRRRGHRILSRSYRCPIGEIDLVTEHNRDIVFVEVKTRASTQHGEPWQAVDSTKQAKLTRLACAYLKAYRLGGRAVRFDVVAITLPARWLGPPTVEHFESAFEAIGPYST